MTMVSPVTQTSQQIIEEPGNPWTNVNVAPVERGISAAVGGALALVGIGLNVLPRKVNPLGIALSLVGAELIYRGASGHCYVYQGLNINTNAEQGSSVRRRFEKAMTINRSEEDMYHFWKDFDTVNAISSPTEPQTQADYPAERAKELEAWQALKQSVTENNGTISFEHAPNGRGTVVRVRIEYAPQAGKLGHTINMLRGQSPEQQITENLRHFKEMMEAGEIPTTEGQPTGKS